MRRSLRAFIGSLSSAFSAAARRRAGGRRAPAVAACVGLTAAPASASVVSPGEVSRGVTIPAFYDPPASLPSADGALVRTEPLPLGLSLPGLDTATRLMYGSTDANGQPVAVAGAYIEPSAAWHGGDPGRRRRSPGAGRPVRGLDGPAVPADPDRPDTVDRL